MDKFKINILIMVSQILVILGLVTVGRFEYVRSVLVTTGLWLVYIFLEARYSIHMNDFIRLIIGITLVSDGFFGYYLDLYELSSVFDKILHVFGIYSLSLFFYVLVVKFLKYRVSRSFKFILVICLGTSIGAVYEIIEFLTDSISQPSLSSQPSLLDTDLDLIADLAGAVCGATHAAFKNFINDDF